MEINQRIHDKMVKNVLNTKLKFFEQNTQGMILNRFSKDVQTLDKIVFTFLEVTDVRIIVTLTHEVHSQMRDHPGHSNRHMSMGPSDYSYITICSRRLAQDQLALHS